MTIDLAERAAPSPWRPSLTVKGSIGLHCAAGVGTLVGPELWQWAVGAIAANHAFLTALGMWPRSNWLGPNLSRLPPAATARSEIALTFDDGPEPEVTPRVLDLLDARGARGTFFCIANQARRHPELCREIARRGHAVENHSRSHLPTFAFLGPRGIRRELAEAQATLTELSGRAPRFFRPPAGIRSPLLDPVLHQSGLTLVSWTRRGYDTQRSNAAGVTSRLSRDLAAGDILLLHDGHSARTRAGVPVVLEVLPRILDAAHALGLRPVTLRQAIEP
ncbi:MAG TPA: polysaccharide deacetylase family protein [Usitatibacter sp.]|nr:polysaccharide deacetylase family protein [Usitatibacter sp.]